MNSVAAGAVAVVGERPGPILNLDVQILLGDRDQILVEVGVRAEHTTLDLIKDDLHQGTGFEAGGQGVDLEGAVGLSGDVGLGDLVLGNENSLGLLDDGDEPVGQDDADVDDRKPHLGLRRCGRLGGVHSVARPGVGQLLAAQGLVKVFVGIPGAVLPVVIFGTGHANIGESEDAPVNGTLAGDSERVDVRDDDLGERDLLSQFLAIIGREDTERFVDVALDDLVLHAVDVLVVGREHGEAVSLGVAELIDAEEIRQLAAEALHLAEVEELSVEVGRDLEFHVDSVLDRLLGGKGGVGIPSTAAEGPLVLDMLGAGSVARILVGSLGRRGGVLLGAGGFLLIDLGLDRSCGLITSFGFDRHLFGSESSLLFFDRQSRAHVDLQLGARRNFGRGGFSSGNFNEFHGLSVVSHIGLPNNNLCTSFGVHNHF